MTDTSEKITVLAESVRRRASTTRRFAKLSIGGIVAVVATMITFFYLGPFFSGITLFRAEDIQMELILTISTTIVRISSVLLAIYLIQILTGFTRYQFRIADHLDATADAMDVSKGNPELIGKIVDALSPQHIQFGKMPESPAEKTVDVIKELINKIPNK